jgi:MFS family permease
MRQPIPRSIFWLFGLLYFVQGGVASYQLNFFKPHLASQSIDADRIAMLAALILLPFAIKVVFGLLSDRFNFFGYGHRLPYMTLGLLISGLAALGAFWVEPGTAFGLFALLLLAATGAMALTDTAASAYAIEITRPEEHSKVRSVITVGRGAGLIALSFVFGSLAERFGYATIFLVLAASVCLPLILLVQTKAPSARSDRPAFDWQALGVMLRPKYLLYIGILILAFFTFQGIDGLATYYLSLELGVGERTLGCFGTLKGIGMVLGAIGMHLAAVKFGRRKAVLATIGLVTLGGLWLSFTTSLNAVFLLALVLGVVAGFQRTAYITFSMGIADLRVAGSMLAVFQMTSNMGLALGEGIATSLSDNIGFGGLFQALALGNLLLIPCFMLITPKPLNDFTLFLNRRRLRCLLKS